MLKLCDPFNNNNKTGVNKPNARPCYKILQNALKWVLTVIVISDMLAQMSSPSMPASTLPISPTASIEPSEMLSDVSALPSGAPSPRRNRPHSKERDEQAEPNSAEPKNGPIAAAGTHQSFKGFFFVVSYPKLSNGPISQYFPVCLPKRNRGQRFVHSEARQLHDIALKAARKQWTGLQTMVFDSRL